MRISRYNRRRSTKVLEIRTPRLAALALFPLTLLAISGIGYHHAISTPVANSSLIPALEREPAAPPPELSVEHLLARELDPQPAAPEHTLVEGFLKSGENLYTALGREGIEPAIIKLIEDLLAPLFNFRRARPGDRFQVAVCPGTGLADFTYQAGPLNIFRVSRNGDGYLAEKIPVIPELKITLVAGEISHSLFEAVTSQNELAQLALDFADLFSWDIDFSTDPRQGDRYRLIVEKLYLDGKFYQYGRILAARYENSHDTYTAVFFEDPDGHGDYYDPNGHSVRRSFLKSPLKFSRISSGYTNRRFHPVLKRYRPHRGIDYAAPRGTPVWAVGDGTVISKGWMGQAGKAVRVRHPNGYISSYGHLHGYARGIRPGKKVKQKQVIGYVGATGLATGPHLDFRMKKNGEFVNPLKIKRPRAQSVPAKSMDRFAARRDKVLWAMETSAPGTVFADLDFSPPTLASSRATLR